MLEETPETGRQRCVGYPAALATMTGSNPGGPIVQIPVLVEPVADNGFRARVGEPLPLTAEGATPDEAVRNLRAALDRQLKNGKQLLPLDVAPQNPWLAMAGMYDPRDPLVQEWKQEMAAYRQEVEDDPDRP